ncbi:polyketide cyclase [Solimonas sp. K1W22B-7]|uniref:SRPBCC family protein n=1 Tax=Solimonas sp. K1W22B-7 TaxID=2303331 RepID=UPI000E32EAE5|nr:SRPBCC family protein [Solimonas sp. K1W22B-7]AXQ30119.1 polyketide cyclase [Solimonas sp. K1W22B-7]
MIKKILIALALAIAALLGYAATQPDIFRVERSTVVQAPAEQIYPLIADFHRWTQWSPYEKLDPALKRTYGGAESGLGASYAWEGDKNVGSGRMEITEATAPSKIGIKLDFMVPFEAHNQAEFTLQPEGSGTRVSWAMHGPANFMSKLMGTLFNMDKMVGGDFEKGLATLKSVAEATPAAPAEIPAAAPVQEPAPAAAAAGA